MENSNDIKNTTNVGNEDLADVSNSVCKCCGWQFSFLVDGLCYTCYSNNDEQTDC